MENIQINTGDVLLVSRKTLLARIIQWFQENEWNHAGIIVDIYGELFVIEAIEKGVVPTKYSDKLNSNRKLMILKPKIPLTDEEKINLIKFGLSKCEHEPYDYFNLICYQPFKFITKYSVIWYNNKIYKPLYKKDIKNYNKLRHGFWIGRRKSKSDKSYICAEFVMRCFNYIKGWFEDNWYWAAPIDLFESDKFDKFNIKN